MENQTQLTHLCHELPLYFQLLVEVILPLFKGDAAAALAVSDSDAPVVYLLQEAARTQLIFNPQHSSSDGEDRDTTVTKEKKTHCVEKLFYSCVVSSYVSRL